MRTRLISLLERWAEREIIRILGRALIIPEVTHRWQLNPIGGFHIISTGVCWERCTAVRETPDLDEFGFAFRTLSEVDQGLILVGHFGGGDEWTELIEHYGISRGASNRRLRIAWLKLIGELIRRELIRNISR